MNVYSLAKIQANLVVPNPIARSSVDFMESDLAKFLLEGLPADVARQTHWAVDGKRDFTSLEWPGNGMLEFGWGRVRTDGTRVYDPERREQLVERDKWDRPGAVYIATATGYGDSVRDPSDVAELSKYRDGFIYLLHPMEPVAIEIEPTNGCTAYIRGPGPLNGKVLRFSGGRWYP